MTEREWIKQAKARCEAATPGPWAWIISDAAVESSSSEVCACYGPSPTADKNAEFIAHARVDLDRALAALEAALPVLLVGANACSPEHGECEDCEVQGCVVMLCRRVLAIMRGEVEL